MSTIESTMNNERQGSSEDFGYVMSSTLEEMYNGALRKLAIQKNVVCRGCVGTGRRNGTDEQYDKCERCSEGGIETCTLDSGQQMQIQCRLCGGHGQAIILRNRCTQCSGTKFVNDRYILDVDIKKGMFGGQKIIYLGEGQQNLNMKYGDFTVTLDEMSHHTFKRIKNNLSITIKLDLTESLCGFEKTIKTLDNRQLIVKSERGKVYKSGDTNYLRKEGMPVYRSRKRRGGLIVNFEVSMPDKIPLKHVPLIEKILPPREKLPAIIVTGGGEDCNLINMDTSEENIEPEETPYYNQQSQCDTDQEFSTQDNDSQDQYPPHEYGEYKYGDKRDGYEEQTNDQCHNEQGYNQNEHYHEAQYHQEEPYDEAGPSSPESLESYHPPR